jgi:hypothetical protein
MIFDLLGLDRLSPKVHDEGRARLGVRLQIMQPCTQNPQLPFKRSQPPPPRTTWDSYVELWTSTCFNMEPCYRSSWRTRPPCTDRMQ